MEPKVIFVTGTTSGFGLSMAERLASEGHTVIGTSRNPEKMKPSFELLRLDVTSEASVKRCVSELLAHHPVIDVVVNNAGVAVTGAIEETPLEDARMQFETNFWGPIRVLKEILPALRRQRRGHIINISSLAGLIGIPYQGFYTASKHALEGYSKSLKAEVEPFNIKVTLIEPGFFRTNLQNSSHLAKERVPDYDGIRPKVLAAIRESVDNAPPAEIVAAVISRVVNTNKPRFKYRVGNQAKFLPILDFFLPKIFDSGLKKKFKLS